MTPYKKGTEVEWKWGRGHGTGKVSEVFTHSITKTIKGKKITRNGSKQMPAYLITQDKGTQVLKLHKEVHKAESRHGWA